MNEAPVIPDFQSRVVDHARRDFPLLRTGMTVQAALEQIRREGVAERVIYFYAVDSERKLAGVVPTRRLLTAALETRIEEIMITRVVALPATATVLDACEFFVLYKFFAFPVVDAERRIIGVVDVSLFTSELLETGDTSASLDLPGNEVFEAIGFRLEQIRGAKPWRVFRYRFPWLLATVACGTFCALLSGAFETTLAQSLVIAFFLTMVLGLNESVSTQSMSVTIQALRSASVTWRWFVAAFRREFITAILIGMACGLLVGAIVWTWRRDVAGALVIGGSIAISLVSAALLGLGVPSLLHRFKLDPKIAAGPVTLALADFTALLIYFTSAWLVWG
jgi:magnesium transporter